MGIKINQWKKLYKVYRSIFQEIKSIIMKKQKPPRKNLGKRMKEQARFNKKRLENETDPKVYKRLSANKWDFC